MRSKLLASALVLLACAPAAAQQHPAHTDPGTPEQAAVKAALNDYLQAHATGQGDFIRHLFHPERGTMFWVVEGQLMARSGEEFASGFTGTPAADEAQRMRRIEFVDVTGDVAVGKVILDYPNALFTDYFALARVGGTWQVVSKIFHRGAPQR